MKLARIKRIARWGAYCGSRTLESLRLLRSSGHQKATILSDGANAVFFGYHDKTPFSRDNQKVLACSVAADDTRPENEGMPMRIGYFQRHADGTFENTYHEIGNTTTWCWQQSCMLQWHPNNDDHILYNKLVGCEYGAVMQDINSHQVVDSFKYPIYSVSPNGDFAVSLNFSRLGRLRPGYGYNALNDQTLNSAAPEDDGLFLLDMKRGTKQLCMSLRQLAVSTHTGDFQHYVNHATFSPDGKKVAFFHLSSDKGNARRRSMRMLIMQVDSLRMETLEDRHTVSHYCWQDNSHILASVATDDGRLRYTVYDTDNLSRNDLTLSMSKDGHPMFHPTSTDLFVSDTYPDWGRQQLLYIVDLRSVSMTELSRLHNPIRFSGPARCDLHPRWDRTGASVAVDTTCSGRRAMHIIPSNIV